MFVSHFLQGLGLVLDPFVRGLMFYYGLNFHDLAPDSLLHISSFFVICEALDLIEQFAIEDVISFHLDYDPELVA